MAEELVTQITQEYSAGGLTLGNDSDSLAEYNSKIHLNIRGKPFQITRDELMSLPESILLSLFPNGVFLDFNGQVITMKAGRGPVSGNAQVILAGHRNE